MALNTELISIAEHSSQSIEAVCRVYSGGGSTKIRERVKISAEMLGIEPPPDLLAEDPELSELNFDQAE